MKKIQFLIGTTVTLLVVLFAVVYTFGYVVPPGHMGVLRYGMGPKQGYQPEGLAPGYHPGFPLMNLMTINLVPTTIQVVHLHRDRKKHPNSSGPLEVQTTDGAKVLVDVSLLARFFPAPTFDAKGGKVHGGPADLLQSVGLSEHDWFNRIRRNADDELRRALGKLSTADFYNPNLREHQQVKVAHTRMNQSLSRFGIEVVGVLLRRYTYEAQEINQAIQRKNLQDQEERLNAMKSEFARVSAELQKVEADYDARIKTLQIQGETNSEVIRSEGDLYEEKKRAEATLLVAQATAEVDRKKANALSETIGSDVYLARELAPLLSSLKGGVVSGLDPYNLKTWEEKLGVAAVGGEQ